MNIFWTLNAWEDYLYWQSTNKKILIRINDLIKNIRRTPFTGIGKPEPLKLSLAGRWSRRINDEHRLIYAVNGKGEQRIVTIYQCRYHY